MLIADSQVHIWGANTPERPWRDGPRNPAHRENPFTKDELLAAMDLAGVSRAALVPPSMEGDRNDLILEAAQAHPDRFAAMGRVAIDDPNKERSIERLKQAPGLKGLRITFFSAGRLLARPQDINWLWDAAENANLPLMIAETPDLLRDISYIAERHRAAKLALDHFAVVRGKKDEAAFANTSALLSLAKWPNISVKLSAIPCYSSEEFPYRNVHKYVRQVYETFGPERLFWGTDLTRLPCTYDQAIRMFTDEMDWLSDSDKELIMGKSLCAWLDWELPAGAE